MKAEAERQWLRPKITHRKPHAQRAGVERVCRPRLVAEWPRTIRPQRELGNVVLLCGLGNHVDLGGLLGGAEEIRTTDLRAPSALNFSPARRAGLMAGRVGSVVGQSCCQERP